MDRGDVTGEYPHGATLRATEKNGVDGLHRSVFRGFGLVGFPR